MRVEARPGVFINIFTTHLQASYVYETPEEHYPNYHSRLEQIVMLHRFISSKLRLFNESRTLSILCGDMNVDALGSDYPFDFLNNLLVPPITPLKDLPLPSLNEYAMLVSIFNRENSDVELFNPCLQATGTFPITYGDVILHEDGVKELPFEEYLTHKIDHCSKQSLDYVFELRPKGSNSLASFEVIEESVRVKKYNKGIGHLKQLSDHYAMMAVLKETAPQGAPNSQGSPSEKNRLNSSN